MIKKLWDVLPCGLKYEVKKIVHKRRLKKVAPMTIKKKGNKPNKKVVYTCITGDYDDLISHNCKNLNWDYVCFTDNKNLLDKKIVNGWDIRPLVFNKLDNQRNSRWHKFFPSKLFPNYDYSIWIDSSLNILDNFLFERVSELIRTKKIMAQSVHPIRDCIYDEAAEVIKERLDDAKVVRKQIEIIKNDGYPRHRGLKENGLIFRKHHHPLCVKMMKEWWKWLVNYSRRDQLSLNYVAWKNNFDSEPFLKNNKSLLWSRHFMFMSGKRKTRKMK